MARAARLLLWAALVFGLAPLWPGRASAETLQMNVGTQRVLEISAPVGRIVIGEDGIVDASVQDEHRVQVVALRPGRTTMAVFTATDGRSAVYNLVVTDPDARAAPAPAPVAAAPAASASAAPAGPAPPNSAALAQLMAQQPDLKGVQVRTLGGHLVMSGSVPNLEVHEQAAMLARAFGGEGLVVDQTRVGGDQMVAVEIRFAAMAATTVNELGFNFQSLGRGFQGVSAAPSTLSSFATSSNLMSSGSTVSGAASSAIGSGLPIASAFNLLLSGANSKGSVIGILSALSSAGLTQLLAQPTLVVRSGEHANFLAGGEVPIPVPQGGSASGAVTITYHTYGVRLDVTPTVLSDRRISMVVAPEVSEIDNANGLSIDGFSVPAFRKRSTSTTVELGDGESFIIAGLIYNNNALTESRVPLLGDIPILGAFFKLAQNSRERQELIVIATPHLVRPLDGGKLPPLPGEELAHYNPGAGAMALNTDSLNSAFVSYGLMK
jgi:pilus assembly protein CpaC